MVEQRYTLTLPSEIYEELKGQAEKRGLSIKEAVRQCLKIGLVAMKVDEDPNAEMFIKEKIQDASGVSEIKETRLQFIW
ncbi:MAG: hypothetical protein JOZ51_15125 [Chloroflexi bacterium]|nr:hypothetical protein [Chloroflexota bacterium]